jgi:hypothetical protein
MATNPLRRALWRITHKQFTSAIDYFRKRTKFGEINEFFGFQIIGSDSKHYTLPFMTNPARSKVEKDSWKARGALDYEYEDEDARREAIGHFDIAYDLIKDRVGKDAVLLDVGCSAGFFLDQWYKKGFTNLHGLDPLIGSIEYAQKNRPHLKTKVGFFGLRENDIACDVLIFFQTIFRVPYEDKLFDAIDRCAKNYVLVSWVEDGTNLFQRDLHVGMARVGFICIEKKVVSEDLKPYGTQGADGPMIVADENGDYVPTFVSHYLFRRVDARGRG